MKRHFLSPDDNHCALSGTVRGNLPILSLLAILLRNSSQMHIFVLFLLGSSNVDASKNSKNQKGKSSSKQDRTKTPLADSEVRKLDFKVSVFLHCTKLH